MRRIWTTVSIRDGSSPMHGKLPMMRAKSTSISSETLSTFTGVSTTQPGEKKSFASGVVT